MSIARAGRFTDAVVATWLDQYAGVEVYGGLFTLDPFSVSDPRTAEVAAQTYSRAIATFHLSGRLLVADVELSWAGLPAGTVVVSTGIFASETGADLICAGPLPPVTFPQGGFLTCPAGQYVLGLDA